MSQSVVRSRAVVHRDQPTYREQAWPLGRRLRAAKQRLLQEARSATNEPSLAEYLTDYREAADRPGPELLTALAFVIRNHRRSARAFVALSRLPRLTVTVPYNSPVEGEFIASSLSAKLKHFMPMGTLGVAVLTIPDSDDDYLLGSHRKRLRIKIRSAARRGLTVRPVTDAHEREHLARLASVAAQAHPDERYRDVDPVVQDLHRYDLWLVCEDPTGRPLVIGVVPTFDRFAVLRHFRTLSSGPEFSDARYCMMPVLVQELRRRGVHHLFDTTPALLISNGLRFFQRLVGFRYTRLRVRRFRKQCDGAAS